MPIPLGKIDGLLDTKQWYDHCRKMIGRVVFLGDKPTKAELKKLGYEDAANSEEFR